MIKGCQRKIYHIKNTNSSIFEEAYFVLKKQITFEYTPGLNHINDSEMAEEAERIITELMRSCPKKSPPSLSKMSKRGAFALGAATSSAVIGALSLVVIYL